MSTAVANGHFDVDALKQAASGRWPELLSRLGRIPAELLDGKHHPCPKCGGKDRFRLIDEDLGAVFCNQCFSHDNGDGIDALRWATGESFKQVLATLADDLGVKGDRRGNGAVGKTPKARKKQKAYATIQGIVRYCIDSLTKTHGAGVCLAGTWEYPTFQVLRLDLPTPDGEKQRKEFRPIHQVPIGDRGFMGWALGYPKPDENRPLYKRSEITTATDTSLVTVHAGEKAADATSALGLLATTNVGGEKAIDKTDWRPLSRFAVVPVVTDNDDTGMQFGRGVALKLSAQQPDQIIKIIRLPGLPPKGDIVEWIASGGTREEFLRIVAETPAVTEADRAKWAAEAEPSRQGGEDSLKLANFVEVCGDEDEKPIRIPLSMQEIIDQANGITSDWPRRVDSSLFVDDKKHGLGWFEHPAALFGYYQSRARVRWGRGDGMVSQAELFAELRRTSRRYVAVENVPHEPAMADHYYSCEAIEPGDGNALRQLLDHFTPATEIDRDLIQAALMTCMWGGPPGTRPCFVVTSDAGRGAGKTTLAEMIGTIFGGILAFSHLEDISGIKTRLLSPSALTQRVALLDNVKTPKFSWGELEALITTASIGGHRMYLGEAVRPNTLVWFVTLNGAALSTDLAQRSVIIKIDKPTRSATWQEQTQAFIQKNRQEIWADLIGALRADVCPLAKFTRWASWERDILQRLPEPADAQAVVLERQAAVDADGEEADIIGDYFSEQLTNLGYDADAQRVFIPSQVATRWFGWATGQKTTTVGAASRALKQLVTEGRFSRLSENRCRSWGRGFVWVGTAAEIGQHIATDLNYQLSSRYGQRQDT